MLEKDEAEAGDEVKALGNFAIESQSPLGLSSTFCTVSAPLLVGDFRAKKIRLVKLATETLHVRRHLHLTLKPDFINGPPALIWEFGLSMRKCWVPNMKAN